MLHKLGITIFARSIFLQGLLLEPPSSWTSNLRSRTSFLEHHRRFLDCIKSKSITPIEAALSFAFSTPCIDHVILGFANHQQVEELFNTICKLSNSSSHTTIDFADWCGQLQLIAIQEPVVEHVLLEKITVLVFGSGGLVGWCFQKFI